MDKKVGVSILFGFLLIVLIGITNAIINSGNTPSDVLASTNITFFGDGFSMDNTTKGGVSEAVNVTVRTGSGAPVNITNITIEWLGVGGNFTFLGWNSIDGVFENACSEQPKGAGCDDPDTTAGNATRFANVTVDENDGVGDWTCFNLSVNILNCRNSSAVGSLNTAENVTLTIMFNVTAIGSLEDREIFNISVSNDVDSTQNSTEVTAFIDGLAPTLIELNISDGNTTWENGTFNGSIGLGYNSHLRNDTALTVTATFEELSNVDEVILFYNGTENSADHDMIDFNFANAGRLAPTTITHGALAGRSTTKYTHPIKYTWTIPANSVVGLGDGGAAVNVNNTLAFFFRTNDTFNNAGDENDSSAANGATTPFSIMLNESLPALGNISFIDVNGNVLIGSFADGTNDYVAAGNLTVQFDVTGAPKPSSPHSGNSSSLYLYYNTTGAIDDRGNGNLFDIDRIINLTDANVTTARDVNLTLHTDNANTRVAYETSIDLTGNNTNTVRVYVVVGNKTEDLNPQDLNIPGNYTSVEGPYSFYVDGQVPGAELDTPTLRGISTSGEIEYTCTGTDGDSGIARYTWYLDKPGGGTVFKEISSEASSQGTNVKTFSGSDISTAGTYVVKCRVTDAVGNFKDVTSGNSNDFTVSVSSAGTGSGGSGTSGGPTITFDADFSTSPQATFKAAQGRIKSFSFDGATKHTITFNEITATEVTLVIASDPVTVNLSVGQTEAVDVNGDGVSDMQVVLNAISDGVADVTISKIEEGAAKIKAAEEEARGVEPEGVTPISSGGLAWLWWTLIVIAAIVVIGYYMNKRK